MSQHGTLYIISAPSGAGKTSLVKQLAGTIDSLRVSISHTTRPMRNGEEDGVDYYFIPLAQFQIMMGQHAFLEHAQVFDNFYGTAEQTVTDNLQNGFDVILEIDWQGAQQIKTLFPDSVAIFILPPSAAILEQRLHGRGQDDEQIIARRLRDATTEMRHYYEFDYVVVNDDFAQALNELTSIITAHRLRCARQQIALAPLLSQLLT